MKAFGAGITAIGSRMKAVGAIGLGFTGSILAGMFAAAKSAANLGSEILDMSERSGLSTDAVQTLGFAAEQSGSSLEGLATGVKFMQKNLGEAITGSASAKKKFDDLGLSIEQLRGLSPDEQFRTIADAIARIPDPAQRTAAAMDLFGRSGTDLLPLLKAGGAGIRKLEDELRSMGGVMSREDVVAAEAFGDQLSAMWKMLKVTIASVGSGFIPVLKEAAEWLGSITKPITDWIKENRKLFGVIMKVTAGLFVASAAVTVAGFVFGGLGTAISAVAGILTGVLTTGLTVITGLIGFLLSPIGLVVAALGLGTAAFLTMTETGGQVLSWLSERFTGLKDTALATFGSIADALATGDIGLAAKILWLGLKAGWAEVVLFFKEGWEGFKMFFINIGLAMSFGFLNFMTNAFAGIQVAWTETVAFLGNLWDMLIGALKKGWNHFAGFFQKVWAHISSLFGGEDAEEAIARINEDVASRDKEIEDARDKSISDREAAREKERAEIEDQRQATLQGLAEERAAIEKAQEARRRAELEPFEADLAAAKEELAQARQKAKEQREAPDFALGMDEKGFVEFGENLKDAVKATTAKIEASESRGTFSAFGLGQIGAETLASKQLDVQEDIRDQIIKVKDAVKDIPPLRAT